MPLVPHAAKYEALSLRASGGNAPHHSTFPKQDGEPTTLRRQQVPLSPHALQHRSSPNFGHMGIHLYNYFEEDSAESGDNSHVSLPWAPGLPQHKYFLCPLV